jgi:thermitase
MIRRALQQNILLDVLVVAVCACFALAPIISHARSNSPSGSIGNTVEDEKTAGVPFVGVGEQNWGLWQIKAPQSWLMLDGGQGVTVAVLDTGIDTAHKALQGKVIDRMVFSDSTALDTERGHGTHVAGIIAGTENGSGIVGMAYKCSIFDVKVAENDGGTDARKVAKGVIWAADHGAKVINISIVINKPYSYLEYAVDYAWKKGCLVVAAAGNAGTTEKVYPAAYPNVIAVGSTDKSDNRATWSNYGDWVGLAAPGVEIYSALPDNRYGYKNGSSFSTALVSGEAALLFAMVADSNDNGFINDEVRDIVLNNCDTVGEPEKTIKRINVYNAAYVATQSKYVAAVE